MLFRSPNHLSSIEAGQIAKEAKVKKLILTHLPQFGDLDILLTETKEAAGNIVTTDLAVPHKKWQL